MQGFAEDLYHVIPDHWRQRWCAARAHLDAALQRRTQHCRGPRRGFEAVGFATLEWVDWSNSSQLSEQIGKTFTAETEALY